MDADKNFRFGTNIKRDGILISIFHVYLEFPEFYAGHAEIEFRDPSPRMCMFNENGEYMGGKTLSNGTLETVCKEAYQKFLENRLESEKLIKEFMS